MRLSYNRAFQTPSIYNLHALQYFSGSQTGTYIPTIYYPDAFQYIILNLNDPRIQNQINSGLIDLGALGGSLLIQLSMEIKMVLKLREEKRFPSRNRNS